MASIGFDNNGVIKINGISRTFGSQIMPYHLFSGQLSLQNSTLDTGFSTTLWTGNGTSQAINTGVDMATQWGNLNTEKMGGLFVAKNRSSSGDWGWIDSVRGVGNYVSSDLIAAQAASGATSFNNNGITLGTNWNINASTFVGYTFQTTHTFTGTTNHNQPYTCHYNPFTGFTIVQYTGSGILGHEIPHHLSRKLGFFVSKNLSISEEWLAQYRDGYYLLLNTTAVETAAVGTVSNINDTSVVMNGSRNTASQNYIMYGWANSYFDNYNTLQGNYEIGVYQGTGASGNKITTRGKPAWLMVKRLDTVDNWWVADNIKGADSYLYANLNNIENSNGAGDWLDFVSDGFICKTVTTSLNTAGSQYLYIVAYDNDNGSGKSKYPRATDASNLNLNAIVPFANGVDVNGLKISAIAKNETVTGLTLAEGKNYIYCTNNGIYGVSSHSPKYGNYYNGFGDYFDVKTNTWYQSPSIHADSFNTDTSANYTATQAGGALSVVGGELKSYVANDSSNGFKFTKTTVVGKKYRMVFAVSSNAMSNGVVVSADNNTTQKIIVPTSSLVQYDFVASSTSSVIWIFTSNSAATAINSMFDNLAIFPINNDGSVDLSNATPITDSRNYLDAIVYADAGAIPQPTFVEQLPKTRYEDMVRANEFKGKNACTAWGYFDGTVTPISLRDSYNIATIIRTGNGIYDIYFATPMDNINYTCIPMGITATSNIGPSSYCGGKTLNKCTIYHVENNTLVNSWVDFQIFGGKN